MKLINRFRIIIIALISFLLITKGVFLRKAIASFLCGVLSFNSASCYSFLDNYRAQAATPPSSTVVASKENVIVQKDSQKVAICVLGRCVDLPGSGSNGGLDPTKIAKDAILKSIGKAIGVGSPLLLDQHTAFAQAPNITDFHPTQLTVTSVEDLQKPLPPGDYSVFVIAYCTQFSIHAPGQGVPYKLAPLQGKQAPAISALLARGTLQNIAPATLNADAWRIQAGLPLRQWSPQDQALIHQLIPEYEKGLEGDYLQQIENTYNKYHLIPGIPSLNDLLKQLGPPGQIVLQLQQARQILSNQTIAAERLPDMLYEPTNDGLPRVLPPSTDSSPSPWAEIKPGVYARFTVIEGNLGRNLLEFRVTPKVIATVNDSATVATKYLDKSLQVSDADQAFVPVLLAGVVGFSIGYSIGREAQALIPAIPLSSCTSTTASLVTEDDMKVEVDRVVKRFKGSTWGDNYIIQSDSKFHEDSNNQKEFCFRGKVLTGHELNYYFQGVLNQYYNTAHPFMSLTIYLWKFIHLLNPTANELWAAEQGYNDYANKF